MIMREDGIESCEGGRETYSVVNLSTRLGTIHLGVLLQLLAATGQLALHFGGELVRIGCVVCISLGQLFWFTLF
jgi:hypothetical protein